MATPAARRIAALFEVLGVTAAGPLLMWALRRVGGIALVNPLPTLTVDITDAQLLVASRQIFVLLMFQYCGYFLLAVPLNWWFRRRGPAAYGVTRSGLPWSTLALAAIGAAALSDWPLLSIGLANSLHHSDTAPWRQALMSISLSRWTFWLFTAVMSWALVPVLEELFHRGYCLRRLAEDWGNGAAIVASACLFAFAHSQYFILNAYSIGMLASLVFFAIGSGIAFVLTRSLVPCIAAHVLINLPLPMLWQCGLLAVVLPTAVALRGRGLTALKEAFRSASRSGIAILALAAITADLILTYESIWPSVGLAALLGIAVVLEFRDRQPAATLESVPNTI